MGIISWIFGYIAMLFDLVNCLGAWAEQNKVLVASILIPTLTLWFTNRTASNNARLAVESATQTRKNQSAIKIAEMRQVWINNLRDCLAEFSSDFFVERPASLEDINRAANKFRKIQLMLNPDDENYNELSGLLTSCVMNFDSQANAEKIVRLGQTILKQEWQRLKIDLDKQELGI